jgi:hypothetical protein
MLELLGRETVLRRMQTAADWIVANAGNTL